MLFSSLTLTLTFSYPPPHLPCSHKSSPDPPLHLRQMMCRCKLCISLIRLFLPLSLSCTPSFRTVTYGRQLCWEPQSVFTASCTLSHTAAQLPTLLGAYSSLPASGHVFLHRGNPAPLLLAAACCCLLLFPQLLPCWRRWGELLMACGVQTAVPATATGQPYSTPSSKNTKVKQTAPFRLLASK